MDVHLACFERFAAQVHSAERGPSLCGRDDVPVSANHKLVTCTDCIDTNEWREAHQIRWGGDPCSCSTGGGSK